MMAEIGLILIIIAAVIAIITSLSPLAIKYHLIPLDTRITNHYIDTLVKLCFVALILAIAILGYLFIIDDFSVAYIANSSNTQLPLVFKVAAVWGGHEGSMLFWITAIAAWSLWIRPKNGLSSEFDNHVSAVMAMVLCGFLLFLLFTSNPFARLLPEIPVEGRDLNPILQDIGLILHPPLLFLGYVGLTACFAGAMAALLGPKTAIQQHCKRIRPWAILAWIFLTGGNAFGSWWAYNELGWGGWWFWDPVENASFIPWLVATALVHSLILSEKRNSFHASNIMLCIVAFNLCLLGTFLVRSGVVQSVHAFAADPTRGSAILILLLISACASFTLFALRAPRLISRPNFEQVSKETLLFIGNLLLVVAALSVLLGTCYPLIYQVVSGHSISVGAPYFNSLFIPIVWLLSLLMGAAPLLRWQHDKQPPYRQLMLLAMAVTLLSLSASYMVTQGFDFWLFCGVFSVCWIVSCLLLTIARALTQTTSLSVSRLCQPPRRKRFYSMCLAHLGVAVAILGATVVSNFEQEELLRMGPGQGKQLAGYTFVYEQTEQVDARSYSAIQANISLRDSQDRIISYIYPQRQTFKTNGMELSAAGIKRSLFADMYVSMGVPLSETEYLIRLSYKPLVSWIWLGALIMMLAGFTAISAGRIKARQTQTHGANKPSVPAEAS
ncbi:heme lyase CcmF/NrfE family subunit [Shewanella waksmanii]|uniref:heme lyase CcmF/NrfE family subunit n=1 Tax=Shewanella waksmanii TaxID=213783 RepID=UPI0004B736FD|nr:heme lyase CcmF/NrfE family subunit [Shewanella waksmanii]